MTVSEVLRTQRIELPSWAFGNSGTRFKVFAQAGVPCSISATCPATAARAPDPTS